MRIVAGKFRGKPLTSPSDDSIRPTADRVRESMFNILGSRLGPVFDGKRVLDLFAGTGAMAFEALSRGAAFALLVDDGTEARGLIRENQMALGLAGHSRVFRRDATKLGAIGPMAPFGVMFCDPPYRKGLGEKALISARDNSWLEAGALIVLEEAGDVDVALPEGFETLERREYGETQVLLLRVGAPAAGAA